MKFVDLLWSWGTKNLIGLVALPIPTMGGGVNVKTTRSFSCLPPPMMVTSLPLAIRSIDTHLVRVRRENSCCWCRVQYTKNLPIS